MRATPADPRAIEREDDAAAYWVIFWNPAGDVADEWRLTEVRDVHEAMTWAELKSDGRRFELFAEVEPSRTVRLLGRRPR